jgi:hypothetical protein
MRIIALLLFSILIAGLIVSVTGLELTTNGQAYMGQSIAVTGTDPSGQAGQDIFIAVYPGHSGAAPVPGPDRSGAMIEAFVTTGEEGNWSYQFVLNDIPGEYLIYADAIGSAYHETLVVPIQYSENQPAAPMEQPEATLVIPQPDPTIIPTLSEIEMTTPLSLFPIAVGVLGGLAVFIQRKRNNPKQ